MARPKLTNDQRDQVLAWLAADYSGDLILRLIRQKREATVITKGEPDSVVTNPDGWPEITKQDISYYRKKYGTAIADLQAARRTAAMTTGLALKEERIARLTELYEGVLPIAWVPDLKSGRLWNITVLREILDDIAKEVGHRRQYSGGLNVNLTPEEIAKLSDDDLERLKQQIS